MGSTQNYDSVSLDYFYLEQNKVSLNYFFPGFLNF